MDSGVICEIIDGKSRLKK